VRMSFCISGVMVFLCCRVELGFRRALRPALLTFRVLHKSPFFFGQSLELGGDLRYA
jgi:hypothetical protein